MWAAIDYMSWATYEFCLESPHEGTGSLQPSRYTYSCLRKLTRSSAPTAKVRYRTPSDTDWPGPAAHPRTHTEQDGDCPLPQPMHLLGDTDSLPTNSRTPVPYREHRVLRTFFHFILCKELTLSITVLIRTQDWDFCYFGRLPVYAF